jgi:hypothetical protein
MPATEEAERRKHPRYPLNTGLHFNHGPSHRRLPGRCENISESGLKMHVPATSPIKPGDSIQLSLGAHHRPEFAVLGDRPVDASVVRVNRHDMLTTGCLEVGVKFMIA